jgi:hypothetical protein
MDNTMLENPRQIPVDDELRGIAKEIVDQCWTIQDWAAHESGDWFQTPNYCGGFEADDENTGEFAFAKYPATNQEFWLCFSYDDASGIADGTITTVLAYDAV